MFIWLCSFVFLRNKVIPGTFWCYHVLRPASFSKMESADNFVPFQSCVSNFLWISKWNLETSKRSYIRHVLNLPRYSSHRIIVRTVVTCWFTWREHCCGYDVMNSRRNVAHEDALIMVLCFTFVNMNITHSCYYSIHDTYKVLIRVEYLSLQ